MVRCGTTEIRRKRKAKMKRDAKRKVSKRVTKRKKVLPKLKKGALKGYHYRVKATQTSRKRAISKMMKHKGALKTLRHLVLLRTYNKNSPLYKRLDKDVKYAQKIYARMAK